MHDDTQGSWADFEDPESFEYIPALEEQLSTDARWCRSLVSSLKVGGIWGVPRSGLVFTKTGPDALVLTERMPHEPGMPITAAQVDEQQRSDYEAIKDRMSEAGIAVTDEVAVEFPIVILDADGVVDRVATEEEAQEYIALGEPGLRWERSQLATHDEGATPMSTTETYKIVRFFREDGKPREIIERGLTLEQAKAHCSRDDTHEEGVWFDGFEKESE